MSGSDGKGRREPEIVVLFCQHSVDGKVELADSFRDLPGCRVRLVVLPCSSNIEVRRIVKMLERGADAIQVVGCSEGACRFMVGSKKAEKRVEYVRQLLDEIDFGPERVSMERGVALSSEDLLNLARDRADRVRPLGRNPMGKDGNANDAETSPNVP
jgi:coenzyme F420-reducing hydrogenase delta subunit